MLRRSGIAFPFLLGLILAQSTDQLCQAEAAHQLARLPALETEASTSAPEASPAEDVVEESLNEVVAPPWYTYDVFFDSSTWKSSFQVGINGTTGNSQSMSFRTGADLKHKTDGHTLSLNVNYARTHADGVETQHNALSTIRNDWDLFLDSRWSMFLKQTTE